MASLRLTFPDQDEPKLIALKGSHVTVGRLPHNTLQIIDRTISGFHAELIREDGHYLLHDRGSTNGTFVNGQRVNDYHLTERCKIAFGTVEGEFMPEDLATEHNPAESLPSRGEVNAVRLQNAELRAKLEAAQNEIETMRLARPQGSEEASLVVPKVEFDRVCAERVELRDERQKQDQQIARLKSDLSLFRRDRDNLQRACSAAVAEAERLRAQLADANQAFQEQSLTSSGEENFSAAALESQPASPAPGQIPVVRVSGGRPPMPGPNQNGHGSGIRPPIAVPRPGSGIRPAMMPAAGRPTHLIVARNAGSNLGSGIRPPVVVRPGVPGARPPGAPPINNGAGQTRLVVRPGTLPPNSPGISRPTVRPAAPPENGADQAGH